MKILLIVCAVVWGFLLLLIWSACAVSARCSREEEREIDMLDGAPSPIALSLKGRGVGGQG
jgi:hypothetical protein